MSWEIHDEKGKPHEIADDERVAVLAMNHGCAREVMHRLGLPPYAKQFRVSPDPRTLEGAPIDTVIRTACAYRHPHALWIQNILARDVRLRLSNPRIILVDCR